jgi:amidohydrolase
MPEAPPFLANDPATAIREATLKLEPGLIEIRRDIHAHPEIGFEEVRTAGVVSRELERLGIAHVTGIAGTGVVGLIEGGRPGPVLAIRADMDALPIQEQTGLPFASRNAGKMHACGHDIHTTTLLGVAAVLKQLAPQLAGTVKLVFQPAEEGLGGMARMIEAGVMDGPGVDMALTLHNHPDIPVGRFGYARGPSLAASDKFEITVHGKSGHAAFPQYAVDPIVAAAQLIGMLQTVVSREVTPVHPVVVTVAAIHAGTAHNIIPDSCVLRGTVRTLHGEAQDLAEAAMRRLCDGMSLMRVRCEMTYTRGVPALVNDDAMLDRSVAAVRRQFGDVIGEVPAIMGGEDFALMSNLVPSFQLKVGSGQPGRSDDLHNSDYQPDEACIGLGVQALARAAVDILS